MTQLITRREYCKRVGILLIGGAFLPSVFAIQNRHIIVGLQTYSLRDKSLDDAIGDMQRLGITDIELWSGHIQPPHFQWRPSLTKEELKQNRIDLMNWRLNLDINEVVEVRKKLEKAGISILAYTSTIKNDIKDEELDVEFRIARALKTDTINTSATVTVMPRVDEFAKKYQIRVGMHNHANVDRPNEFSTPESFSRAMEGRSKWIGINLDIGHFTAANYDPVVYLKENHDKIYSIHIKDRLANQGAKVPFGEGDTPIKEVLRLISERKWDIPAFIEYEYPGEDSFIEVKKSLEYSLSVL